jgi:Ni/Fe-hydrogenase subunit HybB-like protein
MSYTQIQQIPTGVRLREKLFLGMNFRDYVRAQITPFNIIAAAILAVGIPVTYLRFTEGLAATTNLTDNYPWGMWIGVDVLCGVALAAGGFTLGSAVYLFGMKEYHPIVRPAILTGFLGYFFVIIGLCFDLGRPWRLPYPMFVSYGTTSVMFLVGWHVATYLSCQFVEFCPSLFEWLGWKKLRKWTVGLTVGATIFGVILSTLHQSALGGLFLLAPGKLHPLWYSPYLPVFFLISAIAAGISMVIFESMLSHRFFSKQISHHHHENFDSLTIGLGKAGALVLAAYFFLRIIGVAHGNHWHLLSTSYGLWFLFEIIGFILIPCLTYLWGVRNENAGVVRFAALHSVLGIILNRVNVSMIAFNWNHTDRYIPKWTEFVVTISIITAGIITFRWIVNRMPILWEHPDYEPEYK